MARPPTFSLRPSATPTRTSRQAAPSEPGESSPACSARSSSEAASDSLRSPSRFHDKTNQAGSGVRDASGDLHRGRPDEAGAGPHGGRRRDCEHRGGQPVRRDRRLALRTGALIAERAASRASGSAGRSALPGDLVRTGGVALGAWALAAAGLAMQAGCTGILGLSPGTASDGSLGAPCDMQGGDMQTRCGSDSSNNPYVCAVSACRVTCSADSGLHEHAHGGRLQSPVGGASRATATATFTGPAAANGSGAVS